MRSTQQHNPMVDLVNYQLETSMQLAEAIFSGTEKIDRAMLDVTHQAVDGQLKLARTVSDIRDPERLAELQSSLAARPERAIQCQQQIMSALVEIQAEFGRSIRNYIEKVNQTSVLQTEESGSQRVAGTGSEHVPGSPLNPFAGMLSVWEEAFKEAGRLVSQNLMAASSSLESASSVVREAASEAAQPSAHPTARHQQSKAKRQSGSRRKA